MSYDKDKMSSNEEISFQRPLNEGSRTHNEGAMTRNWPLEVAPSLRMSRAMPEVCVMGYDLSVLGAWHCAQSSIRKQTWGCPMVKNPQRDNASYMYLPHGIGPSDRRPLLASRRRNGSAYRASRALVVENFFGAKIGSACHDY